MRLDEFISANIESILVSWEAFARGIWPGAATDAVTLRNDAEEMLHAIVVDMRSSQSDEEQSNKSEGKGADGPTATRVDRVSVLHGVGRLVSGFDVTALIAEYRALRASVLRLWRESVPIADRNDLADITRFNESIDQSLSQAVEAYSQHVDRDRAAALAEQQNRSRELLELNSKLLESSVRQHELAQQAEDAAAGLREAKKEADAANRAKDTFLAVLSHELRTPLTPVVMTLSALEIDHDMHFKFRDDLAMVRRNIDLEVKLIDDLLDLSRITSGKLRLNMQPIHAHELLRHVVRNSVSDASEKRLRVQQEMQATNDRLMADPARIQQVFWNLVRNAVKFTPEGGDVIIRTWNADADGRLYVEVRDTGVGIMPDVLPRIFDAFEQGEARTARQFGGLGLGLAIAKALVEMHGGTIDAASEGPDRGAAFTVALEIAASLFFEGVRGMSPEAGTNAAAARLRVLLVEDHPDTSRVLAKLLTASGYDVKSAGTAASALQLAASEPFDVVVSDIGLPDATGYELMDEIRNNYPMKGIALSGYGMEDDLRKSREAGFLEHVVKPIDVAQLTSVINRVTANA